jgi:hypothetical protein
LPPGVVDLARRLGWCAGAAGPSYLSKPRQTAAAAARPSERAEGDRRAGSAAHGLLRGRERL